MIKFLGRDAESGKWSEDHCQMYIVQEARRAGYDVAASLEAVQCGKYQAARLKAGGMTAGEPDLRFYLPDGKIKMVELKAAKGKKSEAQTKRHQKLWDLGFDVCTIWADNPVDGWNKVKDYLDINLLKELEKNYWGAD